MADHGRLVIDPPRRYYTWTDKEGKPQSGSTPPATGNTGILGSGINATPNPVTTEYEERVYEDGTKILSRWDAEKESWVQESVDVDPGLRGQHKDEAAAAKDAAKPAEPRKAPPTRTLPDGSMQEMQPDGTWVIIGTKPQGPNPNEVKPGTTPALNLPAPRPGQTTDLSLVKAQADQFFASVDNDPALSPPERERKKMAYMATVVKPAIDQVQAEVNAHAAELEAERRVAAKRAEEAATRATRREDRLDTADDRRMAFDREREQTRQREATAKFGYDAGQDAISNRLKMLPYTVGPTFAPEFGAALAALGSGQTPQMPSPSALTFTLPDPAAEAQAAAERAMAQFSASSMSAAMPVPGAGAPPAGPLAGVPMAPRPPGVVPPVTPANRDQWFR